MTCLACGHDKHIRADGACIACGCKKFVEKWDEPAITRIPLDELMQPSGESPTPPEADVEAAAPKRDAE